MSRAEPQLDPADWQSVAREQRSTWRRMSATARIRWLEEALTFAAKAGALTRDRQRRAAAARQWDDAPGQSDD